MLSTRTKLRAAGTAVRVARRMPHVRGRGAATLTVPYPELHFTRGRRVAVPVPRLQPEPERRSGRAARMLGTVGGTAAAVYLLDPQQGRRRRHIARDRGMKLLRRAARRGSRRAQYAVGTATGKLQARRPSPPKPALNDPALARKVESEIFRAADAPKGRVDVNVEHGVVFLRGQLDDEAAILRLVAAAEQVEGVQAVTSLLHLPGQSGRDG